MAGPRPARPDAVVTGLDPNLTYLRLAAAADCVRAGARFIATNRDPVYPTERGLRPGAGVHRRRRSRRRPGSCRYVIGKPSPHLLEVAAEAVGRTVARSGHDRRRDRARPRGGPRRRGALRLHADRRDDRRAARGPLARRAPGGGRRRCRRAGGDPRVVRVESRRPVARAGRPAGWPSSGMPAAHASNAVAQRREGGLVGEGDIERVPVDRPQLRQGQADHARPR